MRFDNLKRTVIAGAAALVVGGSTLGLAYAQQAAPSTPRIFGATVSEQDGPKHQEFINLVAQKLGVTADRLTQAMTEARTELGMTAKGPGGKHGMGGERGMRGVHVDFSVAAQAIGITPEQLRQELPGKSLAQVAQAHGKTADAVAAALKTEAAKRIDEAVANGRLTAEQAAEKKQAMNQRIDEMVNRVMPQLPAGGPRGERGHRPGPGTQG